MAIYRKCARVCVNKAKGSPWYSTDPFWARILLLPSALVLHVTCNLKDLRVLLNTLVVSRQEPHDSYIYFYNCITEHLSCI